MSTRCRVAMKQEDGSIRSIYSHWDGYPSSQGRRLMEHWQDPEKIKAMLDEGDMSSLGEELGEKHPFYTEYPGTFEEYKADYGKMCTFFHRDRDDPEYESVVTATREQLLDVTDETWGSYIYLWKDGKWYYTKCNRQKTNRFRVLTPGIIKRNGHP